MSHLLPCPSCNRHVDVSEALCPFCAATLPASFRASEPPAMPNRRLGRAALMAAGATLMGAAACNGNDAITSDAATDRPPITHDAKADFVPVPAYGIALPPDGGGSGSGGSGGGLTGGTGGTTGRDAGEDRSVIAIYGAAVADPDVADPAPKDPSRNT